MYIHGAGILMLTFGVYWWDPCYIMLPYIAAPLGSWDLPSCRSLVQCRDAAVLQESGQLVGLVSDTMGFFHGNSPTKSSLVGGIDLPLWKKGKSAGMIIIHYISLYIYISIIDWLVGYLPLWKMMEFVNGKDDIPYMKWKIIQMFQTTNQIQVRPWLAIESQVTWGSHI